MTRDDEWPECAEVSSVPEGDQTEGDNDQQDGLFMHVPAKEERGITTQRHCSDKVFPRRSFEELNQGKDLEKERQGEAHSRGNLGQDRKGRVADQATSNAV